MALPGACSPRASLCLAFVSVAGPLDVQALECSWINPIHSSDFRSYSVRCSTLASALCCLLLGFIFCLLLLLGLLLFFLARLWCHFHPLRCRSSCVPTYHASLTFCRGAPASLQCQTARSSCICCASAILSSVALFSSRVWSCSSLTRRVRIYFQLVSLCFAVCFSFFRLLF